MHFDFPIEVHTSAYFSDAFSKLTLQVVDGQELFIEFYDDDNKDDEFLGRAKIQTSLVAMRGHIGKKVVVVFSTVTTPLSRELLGKFGGHRPGVSSGILKIEKIVEWR